jgi:putative endonuclease
MDEFKTPNRRTIGTAGENSAKVFLLKRGFRFIAANYFTRWGEIDLVMEDQNTLVFVEVRKKTNNQFGRPEESITARKIRHLEKAAMIFIAQHRQFEKNIRFDVVAIDATELTHYPNAWAGSGHYFY